jgi:hypothetical protein
MTTFRDACITRAIDCLEEDFPVEAAMLRRGEKVTPVIHSKNGWMTRVLGDELVRTIFSIEKMEKTDSDRAVWREMISLAKQREKERGAWGRQCISCEQAAREEIAWMIQAGAPKYLHKEYRILWRSKGSEKKWERVVMAPALKPDLGKIIKQLRIGQDHNEFRVEEVA